MKSYIEKIQSNEKESLVYIEALLSSDKYKLTKELLKELPMGKGIYIFYSKDNEIVYIGSATGQKGLRQRISGNHLRRSYTKSVFKKQIIADNNNTISDIKSQKLIDYIKNNFRLSYIEMKNKEKSIIKLTEFMLIRGCNPDYNKEGKN